MLQTALHEGLAAAHPSRARSAATAAALWSLVHGYAVLARDGRLKSMELEKVALRPGDQLGVSAVANGNGYDVRVRGASLDARGFVYAARAWPAGQLDVKMALASLLSFIGGVSAYIVVVKFMQNAGIQGVALQSGIWFVVTAIGIAAMDGTLLQWSRTQQVVGALVAVALGWLITTTRSAA